jgi:hypothetical protein
MKTAQPIQSKKLTRDDLRELVALRGPIIFSSLCRSVGALPYDASGRRVSKLLQQLRRRKQVELFQHRFWQIPRPPEAK